jgi:APA family basic amino acid/polyamine antiporter
LSTDNPSRRLGILATTALVVGNMVGSGVYLLPSSLAAYGGVSLLGWLATSAGAMCLALIFARLAAVCPADGGPYAYTRMAFGDFAGFLVAWGYFVAIWFGNAAIAVAFAGYLGALVPPIGSSPAGLVVASIGAIWLLTWVNSRGIRESGAMQVATTVLKLVPLLLIGISGLLALNREHFEPFNLSGQSLPDAVAATAALTLWAFLGLECASIPAGSVDRPKRNIPRATLLGTLVAALVYVGSTTAVLGVVPPATLASHEAPFAAAAETLWGSSGAALVAAGAAVSAFGALNGWTLIAGQVPMAAAENGLFPAAFARRNRCGVPMAGIIVTGVVASVLSAMSFRRGLVEVFTFAILLATLNVLITYLLTSAAFIVLRLRRRSPFLAIGARTAIVLGLLGLSYSIWTIIGVGAEVVYWGSLGLLAGVPIYVILKRR